MSTDLPAPLQTTRPPAWLWPHVLSLEAPVVAMLWLAALAHVNRLTLMPGVLPGIGLAVWLIYLVDRVLDTCGTPAHSLGMRHRFYWRWRWALVLAVIPAVAGALVWLGLWVIPSGLLAHSLAQVLPIGAYLVLYSISGKNARRWIIQGGVLLLLLFIAFLPLPLAVRVLASLVIAGAAALGIRLRWHERVDEFFRKEVAAGLLFAFGCTTWTRFHTLGAEGPEIWVELLLLGVLFVSNLALITAREAASADPAAASQGTARGAIAVCLLVLAAVFFEMLPANLLPVTWAVLAGATGLEILWHRRARMSAEAFRVWADVVVALPAMALLLIPDSVPGASAACCM